MKVKLKKLMSLFITFAMAVSILSTALVNPSKVFAEENKSGVTEVSKSSGTVNDATKALIDYFNNDYYKAKGGKLEAPQYIAMVKAGADLKVKNWTINKELDKELKYISKKADQSMILMDLGEDPSEFKSASNTEVRNLIKEMADEISKAKGPRDAGINEVKAMVALDRFNEKYSDKKVDYKAENILKILISTQKEDGSINSAPQNTAAALDVLVKHKNIDGVQGAIDKALKYVHDVQKDDAGLYTKTFFTHMHAEAVTGLVRANENLKSNEWIKSDKNPIDALFKLWDGKCFKKESGQNDDSSQDKVLYALGVLKEAGYGDYVLKGVNFENGDKKDEPEKTCKVNVAVVYPEKDGKYDIKLKPQQFTISNKNEKQTGGFTALGALQAATDKYEAKGSMVTSIFGMKNEDMNGWVFTLNGKMSDTYADKTDVKDGDNVVWYYSNNGMDSKVPTMEELNKISEKPEEPQKPEEPEKNKDGSSINNVINGVFDYYNDVHYIENQGQLVNFEYSSMLKAGADLSKKKWFLAEKYETNYDKTLKMLGSKVNQSLILIDINKDANNYEGRHLIKEIAEEVDKNDNFFAQTDIQAVIALDKYNEEHKENKVDYDVNHAVQKILEAQCEDGGFKQRSASVPVNTGYALTALSKHKDVNGVSESINKALSYLHKSQKADGGIYGTVYITGYHSEILRGIIAVGENPTSKEWTNSSGKNPVDALFILWKANNSFDSKKDESINNRGWVEATWKALYALTDLKNSGYGDYKVDGVKVKSSNDNKEENGKKCKVNVAIVMPKAGGYDPMFTPKEVVINDKKHDKGFTALGALQAATSLYEIQGKMVASIYSYENKDQNGWIYTVNGIMPKEMAGDVEVKEGDKIIWYYSMGGMSAKAPTWEELLGQKEEVKPNNYTKQVAEAIESSSSIIMKGQIGDWDAAGLAAAEMKLPDNYLSSITEKIKNRDKSLFKNGKFDKTTDCERTIIGITAAGGDSRSIGDYNLIKDLCDRDVSKETNIYALMYCLTALDCGKFQIPEGSKFTRQQLVDKIISMQNEQGGWGFGISTDVDTTAMVLIAISNYTNNEKVKVSIDKAVEVLSKAQNENGGFKSQWSGESSESSSQTIIGLCANGTDPTSDKFTKNGKNLMDFLLGYKTEDGGFAHNKDDMKINNGMATSQGFQALVAYKNFKAGKIGSIYMFKEFKDEPKVQDVEVKNITAQTEFKIGDEAKITVQAINNGKEGKKVVLIVGLFNKDGKLINYAAAEQNIDSGKNVNLTGMIKLLNEAGTTIKAFVWDSLDEMNPLSNTIKIPVK